MNNHKKYTIEYDRDEILNVLKRHSNTNNLSRTTACSGLEIFQIFKILNFKTPIRSILYFQLDPEFSSYIHKDYYPVSDLSYALNLPLSGCDEVYMKWFEQAQPDVGIVSFSGPSQGVPTPLLSYENAICLDNINCNSPIVVKIDGWHNIANHSTDAHEKLISVRFKDLSQVPLDWPRQ